MRVTAPGPVAAVDPSLGRLGVALGWLGSVQESWPPVLPTTVRHVVVADAGTLDEGKRAADEHADSGCDLLIAASSADPVGGLVALAVLLDLEPVQAVGTAARPDWPRLTTGVRDGLRRARMHVGDPEGLLRAVGDPALAQLTGLLAQSAVRRTPVVLDGSATAAGAAMVAERLAPGAQAWWLAGQVPPSPAARKGLLELGMTGLLDLGLERPEGAYLAWSVLSEAVALADG